MLSVIDLLYTYLSVFLPRNVTIIYYNKSDSIELAFRETIDISVLCMFSKLSVTEKILNEILKNRRYRNKSHIIEEAVKQLAEENHVKK